MQIEIRFHHSIYGYNLMPYNQYPLSFSSLINMLFTIYFIYLYIYIYYWIKIRYKIEPYYKNRGYSIYSKLYWIFTIIYCKDYEKHNENNKWFTDSNQIFHLCIWDTIISWKSQNTTLILIVDSLWV